MSSRQKPTSAALTLWGSTEPPTPPEPARSPQAAFRRHRHQYIEGRVAHVDDHVHPVAAERIGPENGHYHEPPTTPEERKWVPLTGPALASA